MTYRGSLHVRTSAALALCAGALALAPADAQACSPPECANSPRFLQIELGHAEVALDGVIVLHTEQGDDAIASPEDVLGAMRVAVLDDQAQPLAGALEHQGGLYLWRPEGALPGGTTLQVSVSVDNDALDPDNACGVDDHGPFALPVADQMLPALQLPSVGFASEHSVYEQLLLDTVVCCDGAYAELQVGSCIDEVYWEDGYCAAARGIGRASALFDIANLDPLLATSVRVDLLVDGQVIDGDLASRIGDTFGTTRPEAFEATLRFVSLVDGSTVQSVTSLADGGQPGALGEIDLDVSADLEANCETGAYTCAIDPAFGDAWDPMACEPWNDDGGDGTGGDDTGTDSGSGDGTDTGSGSGGSDTGGSGSGGSDSDGGADQEGGGGCNVDGRGSGSGWLLLLLGLGAPLLRRRR